MDLNQSVDYTILVNQTAIHAMPAIINSVSSALLRTALGQHDANLPITNHPLPTLSHEVSIEVSREIGEALFAFFSSFYLFPPFHSNMYVLKIKAIKAIEINLLCFLKLNWQILLRI